MQDVVKELGLVCKWLSISIGWAVVVRYADVDSDRIGYICCLEVLLVREYAAEHALEQQLQLDRE